MDEQRRVAAFLDEADLDTDPAYRLLDVAAELGELATEVNESTGYGTDPDAVAVPEDELGDALFALLALAVETDHDAGAALETSLAKYERRLETADTPGSRAEE